MLEMPNSNLKVLVGLFYFVSVFFQINKEVKMNFLTIIMALFIGQRVLADSSQYLSNNLHKMEEFETECFIKAAVIEKMDCPLVKEFKLLVEMSDSELKQSLEKTTGAAFQEVDLDKVLEFFQEFETNIKIPVATQYSSQFLNYVKDGQDFRFIVAFHRGLLKREYAHVFAYSTKRRIVLSFDINLRY